MTDWKPAETYTILMDGVVLDRLSELLRDRMGLCSERVVRSHFYDDIADGFPYTDDLDLAAHFAKNAGATIHTKMLHFDRPYPEVTCAIYSDRRLASVEFDIAEQDFECSALPSLRAWLTDLITNKLIEKASISYSLDNEPMLQIGKGDAQ